GRRHAPGGGAGNHRRGRDRLFHRAPRTVSRAGRAGLRAGPPRGSRPRRAALLRRADGPRVRRAVPARASRARSASAGARNRGRVVRWRHLDRAALLLAHSGESLCGLDAATVTATARRADALITLAAHYRRAPYPLIGEVRPRILIEQDPGYTHLWAAGGDRA